MDRLSMSFDFEANEASQGCFSQCSFVSFACEVSSLLDLFLKAPNFPHSILRLLLDK